jgi:probable F420-dependent oxidoreductase
MLLGSVGVWGTGLWLEQSRRAEAKDVAAELDELGYAALWLSAGFGQGLPAVFGELLDATARMRVASGILSIWHATPAQAAQGFAALERAHPGRFLLGLGASHALRVDEVDADEKRYGRPWSRMVGYLDELDAERPVVPPERRVLAALGPRMLRLSAERTAGAHPYFVPVEHTALARETLGLGPLLAPEQAVVLQTDPELARDLARRHMKGYLRLPNYINNLRRLGYRDRDFDRGGSNRLVDAIVAWGDLDRIAERVRAHYDAGADSVSVQVISDQPTQFPREHYRRLATALL